MLYRRLTDENNNNSNNKTQIPKASVLTKQGRNRVDGVALGLCR